MALFNYASKEITLKVVYYGPGLCGKTTNLQHLHETMSADKKGKLLSLSTEADRTLFFDFMPISLGKIKDFNIRFQLYTVPGQVRYNATRKLVLKGADAVVFVADSQKAMRDQNIESMQNLRENLKANNINPDDIPTVVQFNKQDLKNLLTDADLDADLNPEGRHIITKAAAINGTGVEETFKVITNMLLKHISKKHNIKIDAPEEETVAAPPPSKPAPAQPRPRPQAPPQVPVPPREEPEEISLVSSFDNSDHAFADVMSKEGAGFSEEELEKNLMDASVPDDEDEDTGGGSMDLDPFGFGDDEEEKAPAGGTALAGPFDDLGLDDAGSAAQEDDDSAFSLDEVEETSDFSFDLGGDEELKVGPAVEDNPFEMDETDDDIKLPEMPAAAAAAPVAQAAPQPAMGGLEGIGGGAELSAGLKQLSTLTQQVAGNTGNMIMVMQDMASGLKNMKVMHEVAEATKANAAYMEDMEGALQKIVESQVEIQKSIKNMEKAVIAVAKAYLKK